MIGLVRLLIWVGLRVFSFLAGLGLGRVGVWRV